MRFTSQLTIDWLRSSRIALT
ncbi:hypothetical protein FRAAL0694 [Frankia alni ACN14a]|uniref:Uncharacterized protein n=1 Tax=Frankia alni (strain DSM 45986 / CECT 9034 / ACN14a) TaxID=326424 RepID=Q0RSU1_FRAAA|nr:hypothetical protein FRAAL0694 [Frankia alni ACN14a]